jgi:hypothetical protein
VETKANSGTKPRAKTKADRRAAALAARRAADLNRVDVAREPEPEPDRVDVVTDVAREPDPEPELSERESMGILDVARESKPVPVPKLSEQEGMGLLKLDQEAIRTYIIVAYATRFNEPVEEDWKRMSSSPYLFPKASQWTVGLFARSSKNVKQATLLPSKSLGLVGSEYSNSIT